MTTPRPETLEREKDKLYITDAELYRWMGLPYSVAKPAIDRLEAEAGFPRRNKLFGNRRYKKAVEAWLDKYHGKLAESPRTDNVREFVPKRGPGPERINPQGSKL